MMIPKKIHYCWFGPKPLPKLVIKCIETWKVHFPDYEFYLWNESNSPMHETFVQEAYTAKKYAFVSDYVRFWALLKHGGIYMDTDMYVIKSMNNLLENSCFFGFETSENKVLSCGVIGCEVNNEFIKLIIDKYHVLHFSVSELHNLVLPRVITPIYEKFENKNYIKIYPYDYFYPFPYEKRDEIANFMDFATKNTYAIHLWNLSWVSSFDKIVSKIIKSVKILK